MEPDSPPIRVNKCVAHRREPGTVYFTTRPGGIPSSQPYGWLIGIAQDGAIVLNRKFEGTSQDVRVLDNGHILFSQSAQGILHEVDTMGLLCRSWHARGKFANKSKPINSTELPVDYLHHTVNVLPNGNFLILDAESREFDNWYTSAVDPNARRMKSTLVGDIIREVTRDGVLVRSHHLFDILDPWRITHGVFDDYWHKQGFPGAHDWSHCNAIAHDPDDDTLIISARHQDCIIKIGRVDGKLRWILGYHNGWKDPWARYLLKPGGALRWQFHQHDCSRPARGRIMCFDNGNWRAPAFEMPFPEQDSFSRAVEFEIDEATKTIRQVWEYGENSEQRVFACYQGGALRLPSTRNTFLTFGGICTKDDKPSVTIAGAAGRARLVEVTAEGEIVLDLEINDDRSSNPKPYSAFRSDLMAAHRMARD